jgi:ribosome biogenesis GTPase
MSKRKLNKQQRKRIDDNMRSVANNDDDQLSLGLVITHYGKEVDVASISTDGTLLASGKQRCHFRANLPTLVCGDKVKWRSAKENSATGVIESLLPRNTVIERPRPYQDPKPVAANIDLIVLVIAPAPEPITSLIDRYIIAAENADIPLAIVLNKMDLINEQCGEDLEALLALYTSLDYPVYRFQALHNNSEALPDHNEFLNLLQQKTSILVGQSGVGKSSMINSLLDDSAAAVGDISSSNEKGRHTTTTSQMYFLNHCSAAIIDSPGIREFGLWHLDTNDIIYGLREFRDYAAACKFRDCEHGVSQGCALQAAFDTGKISPSRIASYRHILNARDNG